MKSLRTGLVVGAILWTLGLLAVWAITITYGNFQSIRIVHRHTGIMAMLAMVSMFIGVVVVRRSLVPFDSMRRRLGDIRSGVERQLRGPYPTEVQPLVDDLNALLAHNDQMVRRAIGKAGDLAHGLKTPLAVLANEADRLERTGQSELADVIARQVSLMRRQIEYHLAHARAAASGKAPGARASISTSVDGLARTLQRLYADRGVTIEANVSGSHAFRGQREDLDEMLGNLLDNACKWTKTRVAVTSSEQSGQITIDVDDDGPGIEGSMREAVLQRGVRADEAAPGSGLGLAIVRDLAELYGGSIRLDVSPMGGLRAQLKLPGC
jgi:signal transduction histidine kinase